MKRLLMTGGLALIVIAQVQAQQVGQFSQYLQNPFIMNPAAAGIYDYTDINLSVRNQWTGFDNAPKTYYVSANTRLGKTKTPFYSPSLRTSKMGNTMHVEEAQSKGYRHGLGGYLMADEYGAFQKLSANLAYAFHIPVAKKFHLSLGLGAGVSNLAFDQDLVQLTDIADATYARYIANGTSRTFLDLNGGLYFYNDDFFVGYSANQILGDNVAFGDALATSDLELHHFATLGYRFKVSDNFSLTPSALLRFASPAPASYDLTLKGEYKERFWLGVSYRQNDAFVGLLGLNINDLIKFGYSYDFTTSNLNNYSSGSHEFVLGLMLGRNK